MHGYFATTYKSKGQPWTTLWCWPGGGMQDFHSTYVQISRNRYSCDLFVCKESVEAQMQGCHATQRMIEAAARLGFEDPEEATFREIRDFLNVHLYHIEEGQSLSHEDWMRDIQGLIKKMETTRIKPSTLDWSPVRQADRESVLTLPEAFDFDFDPLASEKLGSSDDPTIEASREDSRRGPR